MVQTNKVIEIAPGIYWVGAVDWNRRLFDALVPLPYGTTYNAYLVVGEKTALVDTVAVGFGDLLLEKVAQKVAPEKIEYLVMNHAEPDHAGSIPRLLAVAANAKLVVNKKGAEMAQVHYKVPPERILEIKDGDTLDLGGKTLKFQDAPWLHWPETMFTFAVEDGVLFSCDFLGAHLATDRMFDDDTDAPLLFEAKRYYAEIMMPFRRMAERALDKIAALQPKVVAPSHGPMYRNPERIIAAYERWVRGPLEPKVVVVYASMHGHTEKLAGALCSALSKEGIEVVPFDLAVTDVSHVASDLVDASGIAVGSPTVLGGAHPLVVYALTLIKAIKPRAKLAVVFGACGWGGGGVASIKAMLEPSGIQVLDSCEIKGPAEEAELARAAELGKLLAEQVRQASGQTAGQAAG